MERPSNYHNSIITFFVALYADILSVNTILVCISPAFTGVMALMYILVGLGVAACIVAGRNNFSISKSIVFAIMLVLLAYLFRGANSSAQPIFIFSQVILALFIAQVKIDAKLFLLYLMTIPAFGIFFIGELFALRIEEDGNIGMGTSYSFVIPVVANIVYYFLVFRKEVNIPKWRYIFTIGITLINFVYMLQLVIYGSRGVLLCILFVFLFIFLFSYNKDTLSLKQRSKRSVLYMILGFIAIEYSWDILRMLDNLLRMLNIEMYALTRTIEFGEAQDVMTGRSDLFEWTWKSILQKPIFGYGMLTFEANSGGAWPYVHNFVLQFLYDCGIAFTLVFFYPIIRNLITMFRKCSEGYYMIILAMFAATIPGALFSHDLWHQPALWLFFGMTLNFKLLNNYE